ncbi:ATP-binding cassette domain-containing protein [Desulfovibrio sp. OttesenSCG-928-A18]|nr:ATP-binding cassette domain-containing protein [Desulfovibrio sp. OttesenSCG-928-A18]
MQDASGHALVQFQQLGRDFRQKSGLLGARRSLRAVHDVNLSVLHGEVLGVVGESGCGKSTLGRMAVGLLTPSRGVVRIAGRSLYDKKEHKDHARFRRSLSGLVQMIFQDPYSSLNPRMRIGESVAEPLVCSGLVPGRTAGADPLAGGGETARSLDRGEITRRTLDMLAQVGLDADAAKRYPHEFSGGQRQRVAIARALITRPAFVVCDEPTSSLDASVQSQVLNLLRDMQEKLGLAYLFISHDLAVVRHMSDRVAVMYQGLVVEEGEAEALFTRPLHPYTQLLLESVPGFAGRAASAPAVAAKLAPLSLAPSRQHCPFAPRCSQRMPVCLESPPELHFVSEPQGAASENDAAPTVNRTMDSTGGLCPQSAPTAGPPEKTKQGRTEDTALAQQPGARRVRCRLFI